MRFLGDMRRFLVGVLVGDGTERRFSLSALPFTAVVFRGDVSAACSLSNANVLFIDLLSFVRILSGRMVVWDGTTVGCARVERRVYTLVGANVQGVYLGHGRMIGRWNGGDAAHTKHDSTRCRHCKG